MQLFHPRILRRLSAIAVLVTGSLVLCACEAEHTAADAQPASRPSPAETLAEGHRLAFNGEWEAAAEAFGALLADGTDAGLAARFELARMYDQLGRPEEAAAVLSGLLAVPPESEVVVRAWFLSGSVQSALGNREAAAQSFARYVEMGGPAASYARIEQARALGDGNVDAALAAIQPLLDGAGPAHARRLALRLAGQLEEGSGRNDRALAHYTELLSVVVWNSERIFTLSRIGDVHRQLGNTAAAAEALRSLAARYPTTPEAESALTRLADMGRAADPLTAGIVHYRRRNNQQARDLFNAYLRANGPKGPGAATALFYLGALAERRDDVKLALENYKEAYDADPTGPLAVEALWERAGVLAGDGQADEAQVAYALVVERFPNSSRAADAGFRVGFMAYQAGHAQQARQVWSAGATSTNATAAARAGFWSGRAASDLGDATSARLAYSEAARRDPNGYYGLRAAAVLAGQPTAPAAGRSTISLSQPDWAQAEAWLVTWAGAEDPRAWQLVSEADDWRSGIELLRLGWSKIGIDAIELAVNGRTGQPWALYRMARALTEMGQPHLAELAGAQLMNAAPASVPAVPSALAALAYPTPWSELAQNFSDQYGVDPLLLYALMRQESAFNPVAGSSAGAFGLTQVIPSTAQEIARALGKTPFEFKELARPIVAVQFGAFYVTAQLHSFGGNVYQALAAYNGGPGNAARWAKPGGPADVDRFYEEVDYTETKTYLRIVLQNYAWYRYLYGGASRPSLTTGGQERQ